jgi:probable H4MPT-linked C1 transfer pathway protein
MSLVNRVGWDIGGAHVKAAIINSQGELLAVYQQPCPLWQGLEHLQQAVRAILKEVKQPVACHAITMTGELVDLFIDRNDGVKQIIATMQALLAGQRCYIYAGLTGFIPSEQVKAQHYSAIASANWLASAGFAAQKIGNALFVDIGSTTTDILMLKDGQVQAQGYSDYQRLISKELVYTGIVRTAVMAVAQTAQDQGQDIGIMAEYFATMADVYRVTGELDEAHDQSETADGTEKTLIASARRLSRLLGSDFSIEELPRWKAFAGNIREQQLQKILQACLYRLQDYELEKQQALIGAGVGRFLVKELAQRLDRPYVDFTDLLLNASIKTGLSAADCAPAVAVACLLNVPDKIV